MFAAFFMAAFFGVLLGIPTLKLSGHYLAMATIGAVLAVFAVNDLWQGRALAVRSDVGETKTSEATV